MPPKTIIIELNGAKMRIAAPDSDVPIGKRVV